MPVYKHTNMYTFLSRIYSIIKWMKWISIHTYILPNTQIQTHYIFLSFALFGRIVVKISGVFL